MRLRSSVISAAAATAITISLGLGMSTGVSAAATAARAAAAVQPDISNVLLYPQAGEQGGATLKECLEGSDPLVVPPIASVRNNCEYRIYLQQVDGGTSGWSYCINPHATVNVPSRFQNPKGMKIGQAESC